MPKAKGKSVFLCDACGNESLRWEGRCPACGEWNTLSEVRLDKPDVGHRARTELSVARPLELSSVSTEALPRIRLSSEEFNRVLGGGIVPGSLVLIAGEPGIGKSTLLLRAAADVSDIGGKALYVSGEESASQVKMRAERLGVSGRDLYILTTTALGDVLRHLDEHKPALVIVDSIQTIYDEALASEPGSVGQIRACTRGLMDWAKSRDVPLVLSGHVTKGGDIAGPRVMEHMVDVVLYMEGDPVSAWRLLRTVKNRFGSTNELGVFEMTSTGLSDVSDPSKAFLSERRPGSIGSVIVSTLEGTRPLLVEIQALTSPSAIPTPRRVATGVDVNRLLLVCAVLTRRAGVPLSNQDIVVNVTGGLKVSEPATDLGLALAIASSARNVSVDAEVAAVGEIGLTGEVRTVPQLERRVREVARLGLKRCLVPSSFARGPETPKGLSIVPVASLTEALGEFVSRKSRRDQTPSLAR